MPSRRPWAGWGRSGASAKLVRNQNGISFQINSNLLAPGNAYTLGLVVVNNPEECDPSPLHRT